MALDADPSRLDDAARAGWLYFIAGNTQDEIARKLRVSRATAQRLVSLSLAERLITFRLEHPIAACMELAHRLRDRFGLALCEVVPSDPASGSATVGAAECAASLLEARLREPGPAVLALGTGRMMRAAVEMVPPMDCPQHQLVSLVGNISPDGSASPFDALARLADLTHARQFPMPLPTYMGSQDEREQLLRLEPVQRMRAVAEAALFRLIGVGQVDDEAQLRIDGFISQDDVAELRRLGAVGELTGWAIDAAGQVIVGGANGRVTSIAPRVPEGGQAVAVAIGAAKVPAVRAAMVGRLVNGLITNETTARALLKEA